jgi:hypothetical protein
MTLQAISGQARLSSCNVVSAYSLPHRTFQSVIVDDRKTTKVGKKGKTTRVSEVSFFFLKNVVNIFKNIRKGADFSGN